MTTNQYNRKNVKSVCYGISVISYMAPKIWTLILIDINEVTILEKFK